MKKSKPSKNRNLLAFALAALHARAAQAEQKAGIKKKVSFVSPEEIAKKQGLKEFIYGENSVWALNKKNADKKAAKNGWL